MPPHRTVRSLLEGYVDAHRTGDVSRLPEIIAPDFRIREAAPIGVEGIADGVRALHAGFRGIECAIEQCVCEGDWGAFRFVISGTHTGVFSGQAPTGRRIVWSGADFMRVRDGKLAQLWPVQESLPLMEALGKVVRVKAEG